MQIIVLAFIGFMAVINIAAVIVLILHKDAKDIREFLELFDSRKRAKQNLIPANEVLERLAFLCEHNNISGIEHFNEGYANAMYQAMKIIKDHIQRGNIPDGK